MDAVARAFASDVTQRGLSVKTAQWRSGARCVSDRAFAQALDAALVTAGDGVSRVYALHIDYGGEGDRGGGFGRKVKLVVGEDALKRAREACAGRGEVVRATTTRGATRDGSVRGMLDDERAARMEYYDAASDEMNAFRANTYGRVQMDRVERRSGGGRRSGAPASAPASAPAVKKPTPAAATTTTTKKDTSKDTSTKTKDTAVPAKKSSNLMSMFAKAPQKKTAASAPKKEEKPAPVVAKKEEEKPVVVERKAAANAEAAILEAEEDASDEDSDDDFGATRKPRRKRAMAVESEDEEDEQPAPEEEDDVMEIEDEPTPAPTPSPKKAPGSSKKTTPTSAKKRKSKAQDEADDQDDQNDAPSSNPTSASKKQKKDKPLSKKALLARRIKKTIEIMDEETGEETTCTIFVDEFENELNEDGSYKYPENVKTAANA
jgi:hypothetical protein